MLWTCHDEKQLERLLLIVSNPTLITLNATKQGLSVARFVEELSEEISRLRDRKDQLQEVQSAPPGTSLPREAEVAGFNFVNIEDLDQPEEDVRVPEDMMQLEDVELQADGSLSSQGEEGE